MTSIILLWLTLTSTNKTMHSYTVHREKKTLMLKLYNEIDAKSLSGKVTSEQLSALFSGDYFIYLFIYF